MPPLFLTAAHIRHNADMCKPIIGLVRGRMAGELPLDVDIMLDDVISRLEEMRRDAEDLRSRLYRAR